MSITPFPSQGQYPWYDQLEQWGADTQTAAENATIAADQVHADVADAVEAATTASASAVAAAGLVDAPAGDAVLVAVSPGGAAYAALSAAFAPARTVDMLVQGAAADGVTDDWSVFVAARALAGANGTVHFPARSGASSTTYFFAGYRPDMSGTQITADESVILKMDANPNVRAWGLLSSVTVQNTTHLTTLRKMPGTDLQMAVGAAGNVQPQPVSIGAIDFTTWDEFSLTGGSFDNYTVGTMNATLSASTVYWTTSVGHTIGGITGVPAVGVLYEAAVNTGGNTAGSWAAVTLISADNSVVVFNVKSDVASIAGSTAFATGATIALDGDHLFTQSYGGVQLGYRVVSARVVQLYVNGRKVYTLTTLKDIARAGWSVNSTDMAAKAVVGGVTYTDLPPTSFEPSDTRPAKVSVVGDSISYGAWVAVTWPALLPIAAHCLPHLGSVNVRQNLAVSGTSAQQWATPSGTYDITAKDFTGDDYVLVMLGTNDAQNNRSYGTYKNDLATIANKIVADGAVPVFGVFPFWTSAEFSGTGVVTVNPRGGSALRSVVANFAAANGYPLALVRDAIGTNYDWLADNIHPNELGQAAIAKAFAQAISRHRSDLI